MKKQNLLKIITVSLLGVTATSSVLVMMGSQNEPTNAKASYDYSSVDTSSASALLSDLQGLFSSSAVSYSGGYGTLWTTYKTTDIGDDGYIVDIYSNTTQYTYSSDQCGTYSGEGGCYNREHTIPKSWWGGGTTNQGADPIIVLPSDGKVNGMRSNYIYGEVGTASYTSNNSYSKLGTQSSESISKHGSLGSKITVFEPADEWKGDLARIVFYSRVRWTDSYSWTTGHGAYQYSGSASSNYGLTDYAIALFTEWSELDPVSDWEMQRNEAVYGITNYRNPFVDHPEWINTIWGGTTYTGTGITSTSGLYLTTSSITLALNGSGSIAATTYGTDIGTISWTTSDSSIAALSASTGSSVAITAGSTIGSATITATCTIDGEEYSKTCTVTVEDASSYTYTLLTSTSDLSDGDTVLIVAGYESDYYVLSDSTVGSYAYYIQADTISVSNSQIIDSSATAWTVSKSGTNLTFTSSNSKTLYNYINNSYYNIAVSTPSSYTSLSSNWTWTMSDTSTGAGYLYGGAGVYLTYQLYSNTTNEFLGSSSNPYSTSPIYLFKLGTSSSSSGGETTTDSVSLSASTLSLTVGETSTLTYTASGTVTWSTSDSSVATVSNGTVTAIGAGTATITATCGTASATCTVTVTASSSGGGSTSSGTPTQFEKVTSDSDITDGVYLIVYETSGYVFNGSLTTELGNTGNYVSLTISNSVIAYSETNLTYTFTYDSSSGTLQSYSGYYIGNTSNSNALSASDSTAYTNTVTYNSGNVDIVSSGGAYLRFNSGDSRFRYYKSSTYTGQKAIQLYKLVYEEASVTDQVQEWVDTYLYMDTYTENLGYCADEEHAYYSTAKAALLALGSDCISEFQSNSTFDSARERYEAWALANNDSTPYASSGASTSLIKANSTTYNICLVILIGSLTGIAIIGVFSLKKVRKHDN